MKGYIGEIHHSNEKCYTQKHLYGYMYGTQTFVCIYIEIYTHTHIHI